MSNLSMSKKIPSDKIIQKYKDHIRDKYKRNLSDTEAREEVENFLSFFELLIDIETENLKRKEKLKNHPKGFPVEGSYSCIICSMSISNNKTWYDKWGIKCLDCQKAIDEGVIPGSVCKNEGAFSWYSKYDLKYNFNIHSLTVTKLIKKGILNPRIIRKKSSGRAHYYLFLIRDNKDILPPKELVESRTVRVEKDGKEYFTIEPWYKFVNPRKILGNYRIKNYFSKK